MDDDKSAANLIDAYIATFPRAEEGGKWQPMWSFPKDGTRCQVVCFTVENPDIREIVTDVWWGQELMGKDFVIRGTQNKLSDFLIPFGWRVKPVLPDPT